MLKIHAFVNKVAISSRPFTYPKWLLHRFDILLLNKTVLKFSFYSYNYRDGQRLSISIYVAKNTK